MSFNRTNRVGFLQGEELLTAKILPTVLPCAGESALPICYVHTCHQLFYALLAPQLRQLREQDLAFCINMRKDSGAVSRLAEHGVKNKAVLQNEDFLIL